MKQVFWVTRLTDRRVYEETLARRTDIQLRELTAQMPEREIAAVLETAHAYQIGSTRDELPARFRPTAEFFAQTPNLVVISTHGAGYDTVDLAVCTRLGIAAVNQAGGNAEAVAEHALGMMLALSKRFIETDRYMRRKDGIPRNEYLGHNLLGKTVGIIGIGHVGTRLAELCRGLLQMRVLAYDPYLTAEQINARGATKVTLEALLQQSDYVSVNCPLTGESRGMIGARQYALMKPGAYFVNTARGHIHDEASLVQALAERRLAGAGLDVWAQEPPPSSHPLMQFDNVLVSPHTAGVTHESRRNIATIAAEQLIDTLDGKRPPRLLNPEVWPAYAERFERIFGVRPAA